MPGWGQLAVGRRRSGALAIVLTLVLLVVGGATIAYLGVTEIVAQSASPSAIVVLLVLNAALAIGRVLVTHHAWVVAGGRNAAVAVALASLVLAPHAGVTFLGLELRSTLQSVFAASETSMTTTTTTSTTTTTTTPKVTMPVATESSTTTTLPPTTTTTLPDPIESRLNVLLLGGDAGPGRSGLRTDSVMVVSVDRYTADTAVFSIPRNYGGLRLNDGTAIDGRIVNEVYEWGRQHAGLLDGNDPGAEALVQVAEQITGLDIHHFVLIDLTGFADVVDALGGVTLDIPTRVYGPLYNPATGGYRMISIPRGEQNLNGGEALAYVRARYGSSDYSRMARQRCLAVAMADGIQPLRLLGNFPSLLASIEANVTTDLPLSELPDLIRLAAEVPTESVRVMGFDNRWRSGWDNRGFAVPDTERIHAAVHLAITDPEAAEEDFGIGAAEQACG
jgi:polyisoprenyl-teichoic acid--peptidoglycan teichoic acid transferase